MYNFKATFVSNFRESFNQCSILSSEGLVIPLYSLFEEICRDNISTTVL